MARERSTSRTLPRGRPRLRSLAGWSLLVLALAALSAWEGTLFRDSVGAHWSVGGAIAVVVVGAGLTGRGRQRTPSRVWLAATARTVAGQGRRRAEVAGAVVWVVLIVAAIAWDLNSFAHQSHYLPTLSGFIGDVTRFDWGRGLIFAAWLGVGGYVALGWHRPDVLELGHEGRR